MPEVYRSVGIPLEVIGDWPCGLTSKDRSRLRAIYPYSLGRLDEFIRGAVDDVDRLKVAAVE